MQWNVSVVQLVSGILQVYLFVQRAIFIVDYHPHDQYLKAVTMKSGTFVS